MALGATTALRAPERSAAVHRAALRGLTRPGVGWVASRPNTSDRRCDERRRRAMICRRLQAAKRRTPPRSGGKNRSVSLV